MNWHSLSSKFWLLQLLFQGLFQGLIQKDLMHKQCWNVVGSFNFMWFIATLLLNGKKICIKHGMSSPQGSSNPFAEKMVTVPGWVDGRLCICCGLLITWITICFVIFKMAEVSKTASGHTESYRTYSYVTTRVIWLQYDFRSILFFVCHFWIMLMLYDPKLIILCTASITTIPPKIQNFSLV